MSSSSAVPQCRPRVSVLSKLIAAQSVDTSLWLRAEMVRLVDPIIDSLLLRLILSHSVRPAAQPFKQTHFRSTVSELCLLIEQEKQETNRLIRGQMDRIVNSLFLRLTNNLLVNTQISELVQLSPSIHQTDPSNASIAPSTMNNSNEHLSTSQIASPPASSANFITTKPDIKQKCLENPSPTIQINVDCSDAHNDAETEVDTQIGLCEGKIKDQSNASLERELVLMPDVIDDSNQSINNGPQIRSVRKSTRNATKQNSETSKTALSVIEHNHQSIPSSSGLQSSTRKGIQTKVFGNAQLDVKVRNIGKRKSYQANKRVKLVKRKQISDADEDIDFCNYHEQEHQANNAIGESNSTECTTNLIQPNHAHLNRNFKCQHCLKSFNHNFRLQKHIRVHTGERPFQCDLCDKRFSNRCNLVRHQLIHQNIKRFQCDQCDQKFTQKVTLESHQRTHSGERPFQCDHCDKKFTKKANLNIHLRTHSGERPHQCRSCEKSFAQLITRKKHERAIHLHVKPYRCKQCGHTATERSQIIKHIRVVHFGLPQSIKEQRALNIIDERDPRALVKKV